MSRPILLIPALVGALCLLLSPPLAVQSKDDGHRLFQEVLQLQQEAQSNQGLEKAVLKHEDALSIFEKVAERKSEADTLTCLGNIYYYWGHCSKAAEFYEKSVKMDNC